MAIAGHLLLDLDPVREPHLVVVTKGFDRDWVNAENSPIFGTILL